MALQNHITECLDLTLISHPNSGIILAGDFNQFKHQRLCSSFGLKQIVKQPTRGNNILDKIFTNIPKYYDSPRVVAPIGFSDHNSIVLEPLKSYTNSSSRSIRLVRDSRPSNRKLVREKLSQVNWSPLYSIQSCDEQFQFFSSIVNSIVETFLPLKQVKSDSNDKPRITPEIKTLIAKRQRAWSKGKNTLFKHYRNKVITLCKRARNSFYNKNIADVQQTNPRKWWSVVKRVAGLSTPKSASTLIYDNCSYQGEELANLFNDKFTAVGSSLPSLEWFPIPVPDYPSEFNISVGDTKEALLSTNLHSAVGPDEIPAWLLRENGSSLCRPLCSLFNFSLRQGFVPILWKSANVSPIPKSTPALDIDSDFRPNFTHTYS